MNKFNKQEDINVMKASLKSIEDFLAPKKFAIAGVSRDQKKFSNNIYADLKKTGYDLYPVNPHAELINEDKCYQSVKDLPAGVDRLLVVTPKAQTDKVIDEALEKGFKSIWIQQKSDTPGSLEKIGQKGVECISGECIYMFALPQGPHKFHAFFKKLFGRYPK